ncbi:MAG: SGNH/GDSL hydrolase family protein [Pseudomonadales bacterium]
MPVSLRNSIFYTLLFLFCIEGILEYRGYTRGFSTLIFGTPSKTYARDNNENIEKSYGPSAEFPFRSSIIEPSFKTAETVRIWIASASYAEAIDRPVLETFPSMACGALSKSGVPCQMLNASKAGWSIKNNIEQILTEGRRWQPDYILLYQMGNDVKSLLQENDRRSNSGNDLDNGIFDVVEDKMQKLIEQTNLYVHTREFVGGYILISSHLNEQIPELVFREYRSRLEAYIAACKQIQAKPVLMTFLGRNRPETADNIPLDLKFQLLKYTSLISPETWPRITSELNKIIRQVAEQHKVLVIDLEKAALDEPDNFKDYFHFTKIGHKKVGEFVAKEMKDAVNNS